jgi:hypothetical protein
MSINKTTQLLQLIQTQQDMLTGLLVVTKEFEDHADTNTFQSILSQKHELGMAATHTTLAEVAANMRLSSYPIGNGPQIQTFSFNPDDLDGFMEENEEYEDEDDTTDGESPIDG